MNEADTPDNGASKQPSLSETTAQSEPVDCPFYSVLPNQNPSSQNPSNQNLNFAQNSVATSSIFSSANDLINQQDNLNETYTDSQYQVLTLNQEQWQSETITSVNEMSQDNDIPTQSSDWVAEPDSAKLAAIDAEFQQMLALNQELRTANDELYNRVEELTSRLAESEKALQFQQKRYSVTETMLKEQTKELCAAQEQVKSLYQQLDNSLQNVQRQETLIETYKAQLEFNQQRLAQLERECALLQTNYNSQSQHLIQSETTCRELKTRLMRQQRQTLQFKAALEKCLETSLPGSDNDIPNCQATNSDSVSLKKYKSLFVNAQPIKPWSADSNAPDFPEIGKLKKPQDISTDANTILDSTPTELPESPVSESSAKSTNSSFDEQIDSAIQMYFVAQSAPNEAPIEVDFNPLRTDTEEDIWDTVANEIDICDHNNRLDQENDISNTSDTNNQTSIIPEIVIESSSQNTTNINTQEETEDYWAEVSQLTHLDLPATESPLHPAHNTNDANSPSPVVYPKRPPKGRKSLASVELPKFPPET
ncbi:MAG: hypothetical protein IGS39_05625 [Calothrix sp. C42_A2020_038]|nr:hypothetical protein [Calothrix sp. C42_A2020_038]